MFGLGVVVGACCPRTCPTHVITHSLGVHRAYPNPQQKCVIFSYPRCGFMALSTLNIRMAKLSLPLSLLTVFHVLRRKSISTRKDF
jgi:hypothetical protein